MFTFILSVIIGWFIYEKFFRVNYTTGDEYLKELNTLTYHIVEYEDPHFRLIPIWGWNYSTQYDLKYYFDPSDIIGMKPHGPQKIIGKNGEYGVVYRDSSTTLDSVTMFKDTTTDRPIVSEGIDYVKYIPKTCPICGNEVWYLGPIHPNTGNAVNTSIVPSSESRYCEHCRAILKRDTEEIIPFYILELNGHPRLITADDYKFNIYMAECKRITIMQRELERVGYSEISREYDRLLSLSTLTEYSKNLGGIEQWELFKGLK